MARKTRLNEAEVRRFMKLASLGPVSTKRMTEMDYAGARDEEIEGEASLEMDAPEGEVDMSDELSVEEPEAALEEPMDDMGGEGMMVSVDDFMAALAGALEDVTGEEVSTDVDLGTDEEAPEEGGDELAPQKRSD